MKNSREPEVLSVNHGNCLVSVDFGLMLSDKMSTCLNLALL